MSAPDWAAKSNDQGSGCYVHLPFCDRICPYCDFAVVSYEDFKADRYVRALLKEIAGAAQPGFQLQTLYFGGGTPSGLCAEQLETVACALFARFDRLRGEIEFTLEANPARNASDLASWRKSGVNRLSIGVQSFDDGELHRLGRTHSAATAAEFYHNARSAGFTNVSLDLIAGVPGQTPQSFERTLQTTIGLGPEHVSVYGLTVEENTPYAVWRAKTPEAFPDDDAVAAALDRAHDLLARAGFHHYELSNFARAGYECAHNIGYWRQRDCAAFGLSAAGYEAGTRYRNVRDYDAYCQRVEAGESPQADAERLDEAARVGEAAMLALRTAAGIDFSDFKWRFGVDAKAAFAAAIRKCLAAGLLEVDENRARLTRRGRLLANVACVEFLSPDPALVASS